MVGPGKHGYVRIIVKAGRYPKAEAEAIVADANKYLPSGTFNELAFPAPLGLEE